MRKKGKWGSGRASSHSSLLLCSYVSEPQRAILKEHASEAAKLFQDKKRLSSALRRGRDAISSLSRSRFYTFKHGKGVTKATFAHGK